MQRDVKVAIMAGGVGSRFWPASRENMPKQFLDILGVGKSLLQLTFERMLAICPPENIYILTKESYEDITRQQIPEIPKANILLEPTRRNTAPCIAYINRKLHLQNPDSLLVITPADHVVLKESSFVEAIEDAIQFASQHAALVTLGIEPVRPDTGYGYIEFEKNHDTESVFAVKRFTEKPALETAKQFIESGDYVWNAGIFIWQVKHAEQAFKKHTPNLKALMDEIAIALNTVDEPETLKKCYPKAENISIDYAIMEKASNVFTRPANIGWSDLGTWNALFEQSEKDENNNVVHAENTILEDVKNCLVRGMDGKLMVIRGLENFIVVDEADALLIYPKDREQAIKQVHQRINAEFGEKFL